MFGTTAAVLHYWSVDNVYYRADAQAWSGAKLGNTRRGCRNPSVESDNGFIWVADDFSCRSVPMPPSTRDLITERSFVINSGRLGHVCRRKHANRHLDLPVDPSTFNVMDFKDNYPKLVPYGVHVLCKQESLVYDCSSVADGVQNRTDTPRWSCAASNTRCP
mmetsp:Transcript_27487/g.83630  ORF Transcript_27487/g.83630 Transcript_27487/m.83630 type:complete len:162 (-) Transcript_27487:196-681(-)